jgi:hypothetical protein
MNTIIQQRINQLRFFSRIKIYFNKLFFSFSKIDKDEQERSSIIIDSYEEALAKANLDFTKQYKSLLLFHFFCFINCY